MRLPWPAARMTMLNEERGDELDEDTDAVFMNAALDALWMH
jgi:hypothetical protein